MPKRKSCRGAAKRFKITGGGKIKRQKAYLRHILTSKSKKTKRKLRHPGLVDGSNVRKIKRLLPYI
ncbi:MAG TPA: 50S ribosomal protein L35 [Nitrospirae bacterium]|nr:50S ribosomal protein L35 [Nitrospirota bacterium]